MSAPEPAREGAYVFPRFRAASPAVVPRADARASLMQAGLASTLHRVRGGEGALLAVNLSLIAYERSQPLRAAAQVLVSVLSIALMYALNDLYDAPADWRNPKKDRTTIAAYVEHRLAGAIAIAALHVLTVGLAFAMLGPLAAGATAGVMLVNVAYSTVLKGVPVLDVAWCGLWGALYAAIVAPAPALLVLVGLMTAVCHLYQALDDRAPDAANGINTTAVRSPLLSVTVLTVLSLMLFVALYRPLGAAIASTAFTPLGLYFVARSPRVGWLLTKAYFGVLWLYLLGLSGAAG